MFTFIFMPFSRHLIQSNIQKYFIKIYLSSVDRFDDGQWSTLIFTCKTVKDIKYSIYFCFLSFIFPIMFTHCYPKVLLPFLKIYIYAIQSYKIFFSLHILCSHSFCDCLSCSREFWMLNMWCPIKIHFGSLFSLTDLETLVNSTVSHLAFHPSHFLILATKGESGLPPLNQPTQLQKLLLPCELLVKAAKHYSGRKSTACTQYLLFHMGNGTKAYCSNTK